MYAFIQDYISRRSFRGCALHDKAIYLHGRTRSAMTKDIRFRLLGVLSPNTPDLDISHITHALNSTIQTHMTRCTFVGVDQASFYDDEWLAVTSVALK